MGLIVCDEQIGYFESYRVFSDKDDHKGLPLNIKIEDQKRVEMVYANEDGGFSYHEKGTGKFTEIQYDVEYQTMHKLTYEADKNLNIEKDLNSAVMLGNELLV